MPLGHAALAGEEGVAQARNGRQQRRCRSVMESRLRRCLASSPRPATEVRFGSETAITLNIEPMPPRPPSVSRFSAPAISSETSGVAFAMQREPRGSRCRAV